MWFLKIYTACFLGSVLLRPVLLSDVQVSSINNPAVVGDEDVKTCPYVYEARKPSVQYGLRNCSWYSSNACCQRTEVTSVFLGMLPLYTPDTMDVAKAKHCRNLLNYMMCYFCDPNQADWFTSTLHVCNQFCVDVHTYCDEAAYEGKTIGEQFASGEEFCEAQTFIVVPGESGCFKFDPTVFDSSISIRSSFITLCLALTVTLVTLYD